MGEGMKPQLPCVQPEKNYECNFTLSDKPFSRLDDKLNQNIAVLI